MIARLIGSIVVVAALTACQKALVKTDAKPLATLAGTEWGPMDNQSDQFVAFKMGGDVIGSGGCNNFFGTFEQSGREMTFGPLASTKKACPQPVMDAEREWLGLLGNVRAVEATWKELTLFGDDAEVLAVLRRRDWD